MLIMNKHYLLLDGVNGWASEIVTVQHPESESEGEDFTLSQIAFENDGSLLVCERVRHTVRRINSEGIGVDKYGNIYVTDNNSTLRKISLKNVP
jgi:hypothetical protein